MAKNDLKTRVNAASVEDFLNTVCRRAKNAPDCFEVLKIMEAVAKEGEDVGASIVGFGSYHYKGSGGREKRDNGP